MGTRLELPEGQWAELRDIRAVPERLRRPVTRAAARLGELGITNMGDDDTPSADQVDAVSALNDLIIVALVSAWSFDTPITVDSVLDLPVATYDVLMKAVAGNAAAMMPDFGPNPDPASPTGPSSG